MPYADWGETQGKCARALDSAEASVQHGPRWVEVARAPLGGRLVAPVVSDTSRLVEHLAEEAVGRFTSGDREMYAGHCKQRSTDRAAI